MDDDTTNNSNMEEVDLRSIEAENLGDDDELDADLEREFLQQQEAKRLWEEEDRRSVGFSPRQATTTTTATDVNDEYFDDARNATTGGFAVREMPDRYKLALGNGGEDRVLTLSSGARLEEMSDAKQRKQEKLRESLLGKESLRNSLLPELELRSRDPPATTSGASPSAWNDTMLALFPEFGTRRMTNGGGRELGHDDEIPGSHEEIFGVPEEAPSSSWLRLGLPSNSTKCAHSGEDRRSNPSYQCRHIRGGSSSKLSVRTATSLERQYSTGSTSTVESPILLVHERKRSISSRPPREPHSSGGGGRLTFSFPGWDVDISKGEKHPSVVNHNHADTSPEAFGRPPKRLRGGSPNPSASTASRGKGVEEDLGDRSPVMELPDEILFRIMRRLNVQDLCSSVQTCKRWYGIGLQNDLWEHFLGGVDCGMLSDSSSDFLPRWVCKKNVSLSETIRQRFNVFSKGYDYLRRALNAWWNNGISSSRYTSKGMYSLIRKLTGNDWSLLYEALGVAFVDRSDRIGNTLLRKLKPVAHSPTGKATESIVAETTDSSVDIGSLAVLYEKPKSTSYIRNVSSSEFEVHWKSGSIKAVSQEEGVVGKELWESLLVSWQKYKGWLHLISTLCPDLNHEVNIERARSLNQSATPTVYNKGLICFRSQVVLRYGLRNVLQAGFMYLTTQDARDCASGEDVGLLRASRHMLQELDVADDFTLPVKSHTQTKLRQCFRSALLTNSKLALHMNDKYNDL